MRAQRCAIWQHVPTPGPNPSWGETSHLRGVPGSPAAEFNARALLARGDDHAPGSDPDEARRRSRGAAARLVRLHGHRGGRDHAAGVAGTGADRARPERPRPGRRDRHAAERAHLGRRRPRRHGPAHPGPRRRLRGDATRHQRRHRRLPRDGVRQQRRGPRGLRARPHGAHRAHRTARHDRRRHGDARHRERSVRERRVPGLRGRDRPVPPGQRQGGARGRRRRAAAAHLARQRHHRAGRDPRRSVARVGPLDRHRRRLRGEQRHRARGHDPGHVRGRQRAPPRRRAALRRHHRRALPAGSGRRARRPSR
jgi:hypothetical protein